MPIQRIALARAFGCARVVFNDALTARRQARADGLPFISDGDLSKRVITEAKQRPDRVWLGEVSAVVLQQALADACMAYRNFFASLSGKRKGPKIAAPRLRSRRDQRQAIRFTRNARFRVGEKLTLPKIGEVAVRWSRRLPSVPSSVTVIKDAAGRYFASFVVEVTERPLPPVEAETALDLGLGHFAVLADGRKIDSPRFLRRAEKKLRKLHKALSRKEKGSNNRAKARLKVARAHARVADARREFHHQESTRIVRENQAIFVEDLAVGRTFAKVSRWFPSSKLCSACAAVAEAMPLRVREWTCACGAVHDRDINAAINILAAGRADRLNACGGPVRPSLAMAQPREAGSHGSAAT
ncbi:transposase [Nonomuraea sp. 3-1Str]|uniref:RNA-guided endonuclease InsQ/TnpB family protein n=1 Tax=Nonomuraea sp. 3-1Str TaxID=2929801 RepID=UPI002866DD24|nr:transposase [Nonomuraea sp. 3-1Str]MDR8414956.1 transposase [Nonomuraea sp. 3-1Str]